MYPYGAEAIHIAFPDHQYNIWWYYLRERTLGADISVRDFTILERLGGGGYGEVYLVWHEESQEHLALKVMRKSPNGQKGRRGPRGVKPAEIRFLVQERAALQSLDHPNILQMVHAFQDHNYWYITMECARGGELYNLAKRLPKRRYPEELVKLWSAQIVCALEHVHKNGFVHRDLKAENILLDDKMHAKLIDFGLSIHLPTAKKLIVCGTSEYMAPEMIRQVGYGYEVDWWALGILLYELLVGKSPFVCKNRQDQDERIIHSEVEFPPDAIVSPGMKDVILKLLHKSPESRLTGAGLREHPLYADINWSRVDAGTMPALDFAPLILAQQKKKKHFSPSRCSFYNQNLNQLRGYNMPLRGFNFPAFGYPKVRTSIQTTLGPSNTNSTDISRVSSANSLSTMDTGRPGSAVSGSGVGYGYSTIPLPVVSSSLALSEMAR